MSNIKLVLIGAVILLAGVSIGWLLKPGASHDMHSHESGTQSTMSDSAPSAKEEIWTCSMHPQKRQNEEGICPICEMDLIPLSDDLGNDDPAVLKMSEEAVKLAQVQTFKIGGVMNKGVSSSKITAEGTVELNEETVNAQSSHLSGRLESLNVTYEGEYVKKGQKIATIYSTDLLAASQELITADKYESKVSGIRDASIQKLKNWKISDSQINNILATGKPIETIDIYADHSGYVLSKKVSLGDYVRQGQVLYTLGRMSNIWLQFNVFESDLENVKVGSPVTFKTPSTGSREFKTKVSYIQPLINPKTRTATVRANFNNSNNLLKPGMLITGTISPLSGNNQKSKSITIPSTAVLWTGETSVVYVSQPDTEIPSFQYREVVIGEQSNGMISIISGLEQGEEVVTNGAFAIDAAAQLNNNFSMMNKDITIKKDAKRDVIPDYTESTPLEFKQQIDEVADQYINLKDAMVNTDEQAGADQAKKLLASLEKVDMSLIKEEAHIYWMDQLNILDSHTSLIESSDDIEDQRKQFEFVSEAIINSVQAFGTSGKTYFVQFCPMAFNNKGANWISAEEQIQNPYFGDRMMKCGSVKRKIE